MSESEIQGTPAAAPGLTQTQRVINAFSAPSKTFEDIKRGNKSWWLPFILSIVFAYALFGAITMKVGWNQVAENAMNMNQKSAERMAQLPADQRATTMKITAYSMEGGFAATPVLVLLFAVIIAGVMMGTINFIFGGQGQVRQRTCCLVLRRLAWLDQDDPRHDCSLCRHGAGIV